MKKENNKKRKNQLNSLNGKNNKILIVSLWILIILVVLLAVFSIKTYEDYRSLKAHRAYLRQPIKEIQPWMSVHTIVRIFNISETRLDYALKINNTLFWRDQTINDICKKNHLNCTDAVKMLNDELQK